jgi:hypothetical protein
LLECDEEEGEGEEKSERIGVRMAEGRDKRVCGREDSDQDVWRI